MIRAMQATTGKVEENRSVTSLVVMHTYDDVVDDGIDDISDDDDDDVACITPLLFALQ